MSQIAKPAKNKKLQSVTIKLSTPVEWGSETIEELTLFRPKAKDLGGLSSDPTMKEMLTIAQKCAKVPRGVIDNLDGEDAMEVIEVVGDFLDSGQKIGKQRRY